MELTEDALARIIRDVIEEHVGQVAAPAADPWKRDPSGVIGIDAPKVATQPFPFPLDVPANSVRLIDLLTLDESPRVGCGLMEMDATSFDWTLKYDEVDYVIEGTLELILDGRTMRATAGQVLYIPKNTPLRFSTPDKVRFFYVVYPANWSQQ
ncbi:MAG: cupin domain-containing protein [Propionibacteriaceae bacterium]|nr:cupin domain-containing protein [Propionibacteriaceae bacterium]